MEQSDRPQKTHSGLVNVNLSSVSRTELNIQTVATSQISSLVKRHFLKIDGVGVKQVRSFIPAAVILCNLSGELVTVTSRALSLIP